MTYIKTIKKTSNWAPLQYQGETTNGEHFYFRDRHGVYTLTIAKTLEKAIDGEYEDGITIAGKGNLTPEQAEMIIAEFIEFYYRKMGTLEEIEWKH